jgi:Lrp/AsnC family leucine-responsive transcriptional regulator
MLHPGRNVTRTRAFATRTQRFVAHSEENGTITSVARDQLDSIDEGIISLLTADARLSASEIGRRVGLSPAATKRRIDRLENTGVITGYHATLDGSKMDGSVEAFIELRFAGETQVDDIESTASIPEVIEAFTTAGDPDALARIRVHDLEHLKQVVDRIRRTGRVTGTKTLIVLGSASAGHSSRIS